MNILIEGTNSYTFLTLMCFLILTGECIHGGNKSIHVFNVDDFFIHNGEYTHGGNKWFHLFNVNVFFNSYR